MVFSLCAQVSQGALLQEISYTGGALYHTIYPKVTRLYISHVVKKEMDDEGEERILKDTSL
jgi:hypothetical protein